ncbi:MAG: hypothetical protein JO168_04605 [Solirubrobacterales bacterium]|nr:hypothetical protein [Solirubrobacterales bacterium]MBV9714716.1 hypothetical protein [Solirubrobacterales bacterium]
MLELVGGRLVVVVGVEFEWGVLVAVLGVVVVVVVVVGVVVVVVMVVEVGVLLDCADWQSWLASLPTVETA